MDKIQEQFQLWCQKANIDDDVVNELRRMKENEEKIVDSFYRDLEFGTGGMRGILGAGTNRINVYTIAKATQGLSDYINTSFEAILKKVAVSYDSRIKSNLFAQIVSSVFAANGIETLIYCEPMPTPCLSYAVRELGCIAGVMITASHNPSEYNGYKVYGADGCQITTKSAAEIFKKIKKVNIFDDIKTVNYNLGVKSGVIQLIPKHIYLSFVEAAKMQSMLCDKSEVKKDIPIVYSPLNGTGLKPVLQVLKESGFSNVTIVEEQAQPDGRFSTCPYPNPEVEEAMALGIIYAKNKKSELFLATDPDCDRVGVAVCSGTGEYKLLSGNEIGILLLDYICSRRKVMGQMPADPIFIKTIVTTELAEKIAYSYGVETINVLTGFKFIGEQIGILEKNGKIGSYIFGFEESNGFLSGTYVRDKDAVSSVLLICEMYVYYKAKEISLLEKLEELYSKFGFYSTSLYSYMLEGLAGDKKMKEIMNKLRSGITSIGLKKIIRIDDYTQGINDLPTSDVIKFYLEDNCFLTVRPSGTEPKLKIYIIVQGEDKTDAIITAQKLEKKFREIISLASRDDYYKQ